MNIIVCVHVSCISSYFRDNHHQKPKLTYEHAQPFVRSANLVSPLAA
jgi:hypothetical protein